MKLTFSDLWRWEGTISRGTYALVGLVGFAVKHNLDRLLATFVFHRKWGVFNYWIPLQKAVRVTSLSHDDAVFLASMLVFSLPFIWIGVALTLRRLRSAGLPPWLVAVFFLPVVNLLFFALLCVLPAREPAATPESLRGDPGNSWLGRVIPENAAGSVALAVGVTVAFGMAASLLSVNVFSTYGWGLFVALPFCMGLLAVLLHSYHRPRGYLSCMMVSCGAVLLLGAGLLAAAIEGLFCLVMALPIGALLAMLGGSVGFYIQRHSWRTMGTAATLSIVLLGAPFLMGVESAGSPQTPQFSVRTELVIHAAPDAVWSRLVAFPKLPPPQAWPFRLGIAYPMAATLDGTGLDASRECEFSSGNFVEPIEIWEPGRRLKFAVSSFPDLMREWSPYGAIHTRHLDARYFEPVSADFVLTPQPGGSTRLVGTTVYRNRMWPATYWELWTNAILHQIHMRVFCHIRQLAEQDSLGASTFALPEPGERASLSARLRSR